MVRMDSFSSLPPHIHPPMAQVPKPIRELFRLVPLIVVYSKALIPFDSLNNRCTCHSKQRTCVFPGLCMWFRRSQVEMLTSAVNTSTPSRFSYHAQSKEIYATHSTIR